MNIFADLHLHGRYSRATSKYLTIDNLSKYAKIKGLNLLGTGDFQHPKWFAEINKSLKEDKNGILWHSSKIAFVWQTEISLAYTHDDKGRRLHHLILAPEKRVVERINEWIRSKGRVDYDGRPIFGFNSIELIETMQDIDERIEVIPAHAWTPWFSVFGSKSGFDSLKAAFGDAAKYIHAIETGLSSDPEMNWKISWLDDTTLISNSDAHSFWPWRVGRECNQFDFKEITYDNLMKAIRTRKNFLKTIEVDPSYGKYHFNGHRNCKYSCLPGNDICPKCNKKLTEGVLTRVEQLATRNKPNKPDTSPDFVKLLPLHELISFAIKKGIATKGVHIEYEKLIKKFGNEFNILMNVDLQEIKKYSDVNISNIIGKNRLQQINVKPGYDGEYGKIIEI